VQLAERVERISISPTLAVLVEAERFKAQGKDVVDFGAGEPDFPTPDPIKQAAIRALEQNLTKYTPTAGIAPLRQAIVDWHRVQFGTDYRPSECMVTVGGKHAIFNAVAALVNPGDEVIISSPYWVSYPDIVKFAGGRPLILPADPTGAAASAAAIEQAIGPRTRVVIVNSPANPTGAVVTPEEFMRIVELCRRREVWLLSDECYSHFLYEGLRPFSIGSATGAKGWVVIAGSLSKTFAMTGWRIGFALGPEPLVQAMVKLQSQSTSNPTSIAQYAALEALRGPLDSVHAMLVEYDRRRRRILAGLAGITGVTCQAPQGAFYVFPNVSETPRARAVAGSGGPDTMLVARQLLEHEHVAVVPGEAFGAPGHLRISYATRMERIEEGLKRLDRFLTQCP